MNGLDMMKMLGKVKEFQSKLQEAQNALGSITAEGESGAGMVKAVVNGKKQLVSLEIDPDLCKPEDRQMLADLIVAATNKALEEAEEKSKAFLQNSTSGLLPNMDLGQFGM
ncbi:YbaB/EbfC family nucleoid-associated protein [Hugenholtzia roseola]|uniref:YbaB/EbfC family nucleoid-associated protein n=1 Tax=Hugenholtzia roseola TaxID=1002 RepID=UPI00041FADF6|nr:YbaB/EbfC family nucleoid-associated protein [Hugenholtzia roseola]